MTLIPVFKKCSKEYLSEQWDLEFPLSEWSSITFPYEKVKKIDADLGNDFEKEDQIDYETNRYDAQYRDSVNGKTISVFIHMNEDSSQVIAIDDIIQDVEDEHSLYSIAETPIAAIFEDIIKSSS